MERLVLEALVDCLAFIEQSPDDVIDPDAAVKTLEQVASRLVALPDIDRRHLVEHLQKLAEDAEPSRRGFIGTLPDRLGLV